MSPEDQSWDTKMKLWDFARDASLFVAGVVRFPAHPRAYVLNCPILWHSLSILCLRTTCARCCRFYSRAFRFFFVLTDLFAGALSAIWGKTLCGIVLLSFSQRQFVFFLLFSVFLCFVPLRAAVGTWHLGLGARRCHFVGSVFVYHACSANKTQPTKRIGHFLLECKILASPKESKANTKQDVHNRRA